MKVLLWTRPRDGIGGDFIQADKTAEYLNLIGIEAVVKDNYRLSQSELSEYDIVHLFALNMPNIEEKIWLCNQLNIPCVISPLYRETKYGE